MLRKDLHEENRRSWNAALEAHNSHKGDQATFFRAGVYDWLAAAADAGERFDVAFSSYGALCWLSDLATWAREVAAVLQPGGRLVVVDYHPLGLVFDQQLQLHYPYFNLGRPLTWADGV